MISPSLHTLKLPLVWGAMILFIINQLLERVGNISIPYVHAYLDDLLVMPIILGLSTQIIQWIHPAKEYYYLSKTHIIIALLFFSIVFELIYPVVYPENYTADPLDVLCYGIGGFVFYWMVTRKAKKNWKKLLKNNDPTLNQ